VREGHLSALDVQYRQSAGARGEVFRRLGTLAAVQFDGTNHTLAFPPDMLTEVAPETDEALAPAPAPRHKYNKPLGRLLTDGATETDTPTAAGGADVALGAADRSSDGSEVGSAAEGEAEPRPETPGWAPDGWEANFIGMRQKALAEDTEYALLALRGAAEEEKAAAAEAYTAAAREAAKKGTEQPTIRKAVAVTENGVKRLVFATQKVKETRAEMRVRLQQSKEEEERRSRAERKQAEELRTCEPPTRTTILPLDSHHQSRGHCDESVRGGRGRRAALDA